MGLNRRNLTIRARVSKLLFTLVFLTGFQVAWSQTEGDMVYKFTIDGVVSREEAKPIQYAFMERAYTVECQYIPESQTFRLTTSIPIDYDEFKSVLVNGGHTVPLKVLASDGTVLKSISNEISTEE